MPLAEQHPHLWRGAVHVVGQAFDHHGDAVRRKAFVDHMLKMHGFAGQTRAKGRGGEATSALALYVEEMKSGGFVAQALDRHGIQGAAVAP